MISGWTKGPTQQIFTWTIRTMYLCMHPTMFYFQSFLMTLDCWWKHICRYITCKNNLYCFFLRRNGGIYYSLDNIHFIFITPNQNGLEKGTTLNKLTTYLWDGPLSSIPFLSSCQEIKRETKAHITTVAQIWSR